MVEELGSQEVRALAALQLAGYRVTALAQELGFDTDYRGTAILRDGREVLVVVPVSEDEPVVLGAPRVAAAVEAT